MLPLLRILCAAFLLSPVSALQASPGSKCASACLDDPADNPLDAASFTTNPTDIVCNDQEYTSTGVGTKFKNCTTCLETSTMADANESDVSWFLYNIRYAVDVCLFGFEDSTKAVSSPCDIDYACQPLKSALLDNNLNPNNSTAYGYCKVDGGVFTNATLGPCMDCLRAETNQKYLVNFLTALEAGCQQQPAPGYILGLTGDLFSQAGVNATEASQPGKNSSGDNNGTTMTVGTIVGIAIGAALLFIGSTALFVVYFRRQRKQDNEKQPLDSASQHEDGFIPDHKKSNSFHSAAELPKFTQALGLRDHTHSNSFSSNAEYYDRMEEAYGLGYATQKPSAKYTIDPHPGAQNPAAALPTHPAYIPRAMSCQSRLSTTPSPTPPATKLYSTLEHERQGRNPRPSPLQNLQPLSSVTDSASNQGRDSYTLQVYLDAAEDAATIRIPPPPPNPPSHSHSSLFSSHANPLSSSPAAFSPPQSGRSFLSQQSQRTAASVSGVAKGTISSQAQSPPPPPPGPPPASAGKYSPKNRVPHLSLPSVPRIKVSKKYSPPQIVIEGATPVDQPGASRGGRDISGPMELTEEHEREKRFGEESFDPRRRTPAPEKQRERVVPQEVPMPAWQQYEVAIKSGKTELYS